MADGTSGLPLHTQLLQKLNGDVSPDWLSCSIFKVPNHLRRISEQAYEPQVISIGPYHHGKGQLKKMEVYKMFYLKMLLNRRNESSLEKYVTALKKKEEKARKFYSEPLNHIGGEKFVEMMLLDGCFIIELIRRKSAMEKLRLENDHLLKHFILRRAMLDLLLVENQIPFFILSKLFKMTVMPDDEAKDFLDMTINFFSILMPGSLRRPKNKNIKHLLGLIHDSCCQAPSPGSQEVHISCSPCSKSKLKAMAIPCLSSPSKSDEESESAEEDEESESAEEDVESESAEEDEESESAEEDQEIEVPSVSMSLWKLDIRSPGPKAKLSFCSSEVVRSSPPEPSEEVRFPLPKAMDTSDSSLSKLSEEEQITQMPPPSITAPLECCSPPKSSEEVKFPHADSDNLLFGAAAAATSTSFLQPMSPEELRSLPPKAMTIASSSLSKKPEEIVLTAAASVDDSVRILKTAAASVDDSVCIPVTAAASVVDSVRIPVPEVKLGPCAALRKIFVSQFCCKRPSDHKRLFIPSATELSEAGVKFKEIKGRLFDIKFQKGFMSIPTLSVNDDTESILRNFVAYEQCFKRTSQKYFRRTSPKSFTDYITFMDCLINTGKDVELLRSCGVIDNWLGDHEVVAAIFNKLRDSVLISEKDFSYAKTFKKVNEHCGRKCNQWKANLWHNYFNTPWAAISFFAAVFLLLLTVLQSVYAVLSYQFK